MVIGGVALTQSISGACMGRYAAGFIDSLQHTGMMLCRNWRNNIEKNGPNLTKICKMFGFKWVESSQKLSLEFSFPF